jgi:hypothetical protein
MPLGVSGLGMESVTGAVVWLISKGLGGRVLLGSGTAVAVSGIGEVVVMLL